MKERKQKQNRKMEGVEKSNFFKFGQFFNFLFISLIELWEVDKWFNKY